MDIIRAELRETQEQGELFGQPCTVHKRVLVDANTGHELSNAEVERAFARCAITGVHVKTKREYIDRNDIPGLAFVLYMDETTVTLSDSFSDMPTKLSKADFMTYYELD